MADKTDPAEVRPVGVVTAHDTWGPTVELRFLKASLADPRNKLQQKWASISGRTEWRDVPMVSEP